MSDGEYHFVAVFPIGTFGIVTQMIEIQNRKNVHQVQRAARMSRASLRQSGQYQFANVLSNRFKLIHNEKVKLVVFEELSPTMIVNSPGSRCQPFSTIYTDKSRLVR